MENTRFEIFLVTLPGLEASLAEEARELGFEAVEQGQGGVTCQGGWPEVWRANICLRGAVRVLVRFASFRAMHLAQLDKRARKVAWGSILPADKPVKVEAVCRKSRIYHAGAATDRVARAIRETLGAQVSNEAELRVLVRIEDDLCTISLDTTGQPLHRRGHKEAVGKAPLRETMAAGFLRACGFTGTETVVDPMCGSGTFVLEAADISAGLVPGRSRSFAFEQFRECDIDAVQALKTQRSLGVSEVLHFGSDRDQGAVAMATKNAQKAGVDEHCQFLRHAVSDLHPPDAPPGLVMVNPPYGARIGNRKLLFSLYGSLGKVLQDRFQGWRVGLVTSDGGLAKATGLPFSPPKPPVAHGGLKVTLWRTGALL